MTDDQPVGPEPPARTVAVVGCGAIGGYFAFALEKAGQHVVLCTRQPFDRLRVETEGAVHTVDAPVITDPGDCPNADWVVLATKGHQTAGAADWLVTASGHHPTGVLVLQNGVEHVERVAPFVGGTPVVPAVVLCGAEALEPGFVRHHGFSSLIVPDSDLGWAVARLFGNGPTGVTVSPSFELERWRKLVQNITAGPLTAITGRRLEVMQEPEIAELAAELALEAAAVARACGVAMTDELATGVVDGFRRVGPTMGTSMLYDRLAGRRLECEELTGAVVRLGERHGVPTPGNRSVLTLLRNLGPLPR
ncbi:MAG TPA: 2-dehydropantoate 2-reductase [Acidimicrobiales bacterium]|jgi:2-dehydropantoate 2-reductase